MKVVGRKRCRETGKESRAGKGWGGKGDAHMMVLKVKSRERERKNREGYWEPGREIGERAKSHTGGVCGGCGVNIILTS